MKSVTLHEEKYRGEDAIRRLKGVVVAVAGCGALGSNLTDNLFRQGLRDFTLVDDDRVESHNVGTQIYNSTNVGEQKVSALETHLYNLEPWKVVKHTQRITKDNVGKVFKDAQLILDTFDNTQSRQVMQDYARKVGKPTLHVGLAENYGEAVWDEKYRVPADVAGEVCDYPLARNIIMLTVAVASELVMRFLLEGKKESLCVTLRDFKVTPYR